MSQFVGLIVSLDCGDVLGNYQGIVAAVNNDAQTISLENAFQNGKRCPLPLVTISASDIKNLSVVDSTVKSSTSNQAAKSQDNGLPSVSKTPSKNKLSPCDDSLTSVTPSKTKQSPNFEKQNFMPSPQPHSFTNYESPGKPRWTSNSWHALDCESKQGKSTPPHKAMNGRHKMSRNEDCFGASVDAFDGEFDFEKNLALFDKQAVFDEIDSRKTWNNIRAASDKQTVAKFKCDENVLPSEPVVLSQIKMNGTSEKNGSTVAVPLTSSLTSEYVTDAGLIVPTISYETRSKLLNAAASKGLTVERQIEVAGRSAAEISLQLLGGGHRLNPKNAHQLPQVVVICDTYLEGAIAINCVRHLAMRNVKVTALVLQGNNVLNEFDEELKLFAMTEQRIIHDTKDLPEKQVDLVVSAVDGHNEPSHPSSVIRSQVVAWLERIKANLVAIDPPVYGSSLGTAKCSLALALPLALDKCCGQILLCDLAIPRSIYKDLDIQYSSPFAHKFFIPLHPRHA